MRKILFFLCMGLFLNISAQEIKTDSLIEVKEIQEVVLKNLRKKQYIDHTSYTFGAEELEKARHSKDLLITLPELKLDHISNNIVSIKGGRVLFLVNGIEVSDNQIRSIAPTTVVRIEYFDIPPARWANRADIVVNIITRNPEVGISYGADIMGGNTGFLNASAYAGYTKGKNDFGLEYDIKLRDYNNRVAIQKYKYQLNSVNYESYATARDHFGYTAQSIVGRYTFIEPKKIAFQAKFTISPFNNFSRGGGHSLFIKGNDADVHNLDENSSSRYIDPKIDLYFSKNFGEKDELIFNFVGSHFSTKSIQDNREWNIATGLDVFNNEMNISAKQTGIVGEISHNHTFQKGKLTSGYRISNTFVANDVVNILGRSQFDVNYLEQYFYTEYYGKLSKLGYRIGLGVINIHNKTVETTQDDWVPTPKIVLSYPLAQNQSLRFSSSYTSKSPSANQLSPNLIQITPNIVKRGNPLLQNQKMFRNSLIYSFNSKYFDINMKAYYNRYERYIYRNYTFDGLSNYYILTHGNGSFSEVGMEISGAIKPFGNELLVIHTYLEPMNTSLKIGNGQKLKHKTIVNSFNITSKYKQFSLQYAFNIPVYQLYGGAFLDRNENANHLSLGFQFKNWKFFTGMYWMGTPSEYKTESLKESIVQDISQTRIFNNKNMFIGGVSYDFSRGKKLKLQQKLKNQTKGAVTF